MMMQLGERRDAAGGDNAAGRRSDHHDSRCHRFCRFPSPMSVRYIYTLLFLLANVFAWVIRESHVTFFERQRRSGCHGNHDCLAADGVLVISHTSFKLMALPMVASQDSPLGGKIAPFGAGIFLFIQLISVMRLITKLNHKWCRTNFETRYLVVIAVSVIAYSGSMVAIILMSLWYTGCGLNVAFIGTTMILVLLLPLISIKSKANGFYMEPGMVGAYSVFLCFAAITSEPETECYKKEKAGAWAHFKTIVGFVVGLVSTAAAVFSTGQEYKCIQFRNVVESEDDVPYGYGFFHSVFATGCMYFAMLFVGWDTHHTTMGKWNVDIGWTSAWVHIVNEGLAVISFVAILLARIYGIGWLGQVLGRIFGIGGQQHQSSEMQVLSRRRDDDDEEAPPSSPSTVDLEDDMIGHGGVPSPVVPLLHDQVVQDDGTINADDPPPPPGHAAAGPSSAACAAGRRRDDAGRRGNNSWTMRLTTRNVLLCCLCVHVILICFASLYMLLLYAQR
ncbi:unnamed protein product [Urochloa decumbens]|uniref:Uncharacterized protein n=1 Tax=Urochloa decumbens TaxID=240449 RepID=A0ABC9GWR9_9POAL